MEQQWVAANTIAARALDVVARMREVAPFDLPERVMGQHILTPAEAERWARDSHMLENTEQAERIALLEAPPEKRGPGRPRKDTAKA